MPMDRTVGAEGFSEAMGDILGDVYSEVMDASRASVTEGAKVGKRETVANARDVITPHNGDYFAGWSYRVSQDADGWSSEVGNSKVPGLAHLLEKGHARVGGGRVAARVHIAPAAEEAFDAAWEELLEEVRL